MPSAFPLQPLLDLAHTRTTDAARKLGELIATERDGADKLKMLEDYRHEYHSRFMDAMRDGITPDAWRNYAGFLGKIDEAVAMQRRIVDQSRLKTQQGQKAWLAQRNRVQAFDTLARKHERAEARVEARQEQKLTDDHAARRRPDSDAD